MNYGAMGMVMGHEVTHGFDDEGRKFSPTGALEEWWDPQASARFEERAECVEKLYDGYTVQDLHVNGGLTLGENIADFGGIKLATRAYAQWAKDNGAEEGLAGFTPEQLLYVGYAQGWCGMQKPEKERMQVQTDPHSPSKYRVNGPLSQLPAFAEAFDCPVGAPMHPAEICEVW
jgi:predicted metalloendopeptidase